MKKNDNLNATVTETYKVNNKRITFTSKPNTKSDGIGVVGIIFTVFLIVSLCRIMFNASTGSLSFTGFLETLTTIPSNTNSFNFLLETITINGDWGIFNFFRDFLNILLEPIRVVLWVGDNTSSALNYIFYIFKYLLGF